MLTFSSPIHFPIHYNLAWNGKFFHKAKWWTNTDSHVSSLHPPACEPWHVIGSGAHLFSRYFLSVCMIQIQTSFQLNRKRRWTVNRAKGNIIIGGKLKHGTQHGSGGMLNGLNSGAYFSFMVVVYCEQKARQSCRSLLSFFIYSSHPEPKMHCSSAQNNLEWEIFARRLVCHLESECGDIPPLIGF